MKWAADVAHVREVSLLGSADLRYWQDRLDGERLTAAESDGRAQVLIIGADAVFKGIRFCELSISVLVAAGEGDAAYLLQAFNSRRLFAFVERRLFSTPYDHAEVRVSASIPLSFRVARRGQLLLEARMNTEVARDPVRDAEDGWSGPVFLPSTRGEGRGKAFIAQLSGHTRRFPFLGGVDTFAVAGPGWKALDSLALSRFAAGEWIVRGDASHRKSRTYERSRLPAL